MHPTTCQYCGEPVVECLRHFEASSYTNAPRLSHIADRTFTNINDAIVWFKAQPNAHILRVFQGCDRENEVFTIEE